MQASRTQTNPKVESTAFEVGDALPTHEGARLVHCSKWPEIRRNVEEGPNNKPTRSLNERSRVYLP